MYDTRLDCVKYSVLGLHLGLIANVYSLAAIDVLLHLQDRLSRSARHLGKQLQVTKHNIHNDNRNILDSFYVDQHRYGHDHLMCGPHNKTRRVNGYDEKPGALCSIQCLMIIKRCFNRGHESRNGFMSVFMTLTKEDCARPNLIYRKHFSI